MTPRQKQIQKAVAKHGGISAAARALGIKRQTVQDALRGPGRRMRLGSAPQPDAPTGQVHYRQPIVRPRPADGEVKTYLLTCAQVNTDVHAEFWRNLQAYRKKLGAEILCATLTYDQRQYGRADQIKSRSQVERELRQEPSARRPRAGVWIADEVAPFISDQRVKLAPTLQWCGELNILPTRERPLSKLYSYTGGDSSVVPHTKIALESVPTGKHEPTKFLYSTGAVTLRNYIQKHAGQLAEFHHAYGALIVEVLSDGRWFARQINATSDGSFQDLTNFVSGGKVTKRNVAGFHPGDIHASKMDRDVRELCWGQGGVVDQLRPDEQFLHDLLDFHSATHHERKSARKRFESLLARENDVAAEIVATRLFLAYSNRPWLKSVIVPSNHDEHGDRWLDEGDPREDPQNSALWHETNAAMRAALKRGETWFFSKHFFGDLATVLERDSKYVFHEIEMAWHGDLGPNGARGSTQGLIKTCRRISKGHDHQAAIRDGVYSAGVCARTLDYARGPSSWSISHVVIYPNGKRCIITQNGADYWAPRKVRRKAA